jgi:hypothetical protein
MENSFSINLYVSEEIKRNTKEGVWNSQWKTRIRPKVVIYCRPIRNSRINVVPMHDTKTYGVVELLFRAFLT